MDCEVVMKKKVILISSILFFLDVAIKVLVRNYVTRITIIPHFFALSYTKNEGAAFSILSGNLLFLILASILVFAFLFYEIWKKKLKKIEYYSYSLILAGLCGNLVDRIFFHYVTDYLEFQFMGHVFPVFNLADCFIVIGVFLIFFDMLRGDKNDV